MKTILVPTDFSEYALNALNAAASIAKKSEAQIKIVHTFNWPSSEFGDNRDPKDCYKELGRIAKEKLNNIAHTDILKEIRISINLEQNMNPWELITNEKYKNVDLIVIGSHGKSGYNKLFIGSNAEKIIRIAKAPVLTIKTN